MNIMDSLVQFMYFDGKANDPVKLATDYAFSLSPDGNNLLYNPVYSGYYPDERYAGVSFNRELTFLRLDFWVMWLPC